MNFMSCCLLKLIMLISLTKSSYACSNIDSVEKIITAENARFIALAEMIERNNHRYLVSIDPFQKFEIDVDQEGRCNSMTGGPRRNYLLLSDLNLNELKATKEPSRYISLHHLEFLSGTSLEKKILMITEFPEGYPNKLWSLCQNDHDCVIAKNGCSINKKHLPRYLNLIGSSKRTGHSCSHGDKKQRNHKSHCVKFLCE